MSGDANAAALTYLQDYEASGKDYATTLADHKAIYKNLFDRVDLTLQGNAVQEAKDTELRIKEFHKRPIRSLLLTTSSLGVIFLFPLRSQVRNQPTCREYGILMHANTLPGIPNIPLTSMWR